MRLIRKTLYRRSGTVTTLLAAGAAALLPACAAMSHPPHQIADDAWTPHVAEPEFPFAEGPIVLVDAAHGNWHTVDGRFGAFAELLRQDGYRVRSVESTISSAGLAQADVFVIANAVLGGEDSEWVLPTPGAFTPSEIDALKDWVGAGGSLLLIADHMPFPGAAAELAEAFGIVFYNGYAKKSLHESGTLVFSGSSGLSTQHPIVRGRKQSESIPAVKSFTGQAFRVVASSLSLMAMPDDWALFLPKQAGEFTGDTPKISTRGLVQGATLRHGEGRVAVFGEAAMFTAQTYAAAGRLVRFGLNDPEAAHNGQFVLNVLHWLSGLLD